MKQILLAILCIIILALMAGMYSCRAFKTTTTEHEVTSDSSFSKTGETQSVKTDKTKITDQKDIQKKGTIKLTFEFPANDTTTKKPVKPTGDKVNDALQYLFNQNPKSVTIDGDMSILDHSKITTEFDTKDSSGSNDMVNVRKVWSDETKKSDVKVDQFSIWKLFPWYVWVILLVTLVIVGRIAYVKYLKPFLIIKKIL